MLVELRLNVILIQFADDLAFVYVIAEVYGEALDNAAGLRFNFDFTDGLNFAGCDDGTGQVHALDFGDFFRVDLGRGVADGL